MILVNDVDDPDSANWYVDGILEQQPYRFLLDTGATFTTILSDDYLSTFTPIGTRDSAGVFSSTKNDLIVLPNLKIGSFSAKDVTIARAPKNKLGIKNILGMSFFKDKALHFLFDVGEVQILNKNKIPEQLTLFDLFMGENFHPYLDISWQGNTFAKGVWDTGAGVTVFDSKFIKKHPQFFKLAGNSEGTDSTGAKKETPIYEMKDFVLGGKQFPVTKVVAIDLSVPNSIIKTPMDFILGYPILRKANWFFDFPQRKWGISKII